jgi:hypothetical protein
VAGLQTGIEKLSFKWITVGNIADKLTAGGKHTAPKTRPLRCGALFSGIGGFCLGFEEADFSTAWAVELNEHAVMTYRENLPHVRLLDKSVEAVSVEADNLAFYRSGDFGFLEADLAFSFEHDIEIDVSALASLHSPVGVQYFEPENCAIIYGALSEVSPYEARDERFWAYLSHTYLLEHGRARWPIC